MSLSLENRRLWEAGGTEWVEAEVGERGASEAEGEGPVKWGRTGAEAAAAPSCVRRLAVGTSAGADMSAELR